MDDDGAAGVPEWVVTYGDMMSLLLTFFIMLVSLSEIVDDKKYRAILESLQRYIGYRSTLMAPPGEHFPLNSIMERLLTLGSLTEQKRGRGGVPNESLPGKDTRVFHKEQGTAVQVADAIPFPPGKVFLSPKARSQLEEMVEMLAGKPNKIEIVGHVAPGPLPPASFTTDKILLSYLRARAVLEYLERHGIARERIRIQAAGATRPLPSSGDYGLEKNDRVEILMLDKFASHFQGRVER